jgi:hypothetical protein
VTALHSVEFHTFTHCGLAKLPGSLALHYKFSALLCVMKCVWMCMSMLGHTQHVSVMMLHVASVVYTPAAGLSGPKSHHLLAQKLRGFTAIPCIAHIEH